MSTDRDAAGGEIETDGLDATTRNTLLDLGERLVSADGPLVGDGDAEKAEDLVGRMFEAVGGSRVAEVDTNVDELRIEARNDDTHWRKETEVPAYRTECGPLRIMEDPDEEVDGHLEVLPNSQQDGHVTVDSNLLGTCDGVDHEQGALHYLTPRQARTFAAALLEQADYVEGEQ
jgi:hypothetical protein